MAALPQELIEDILSRLPVKSLLRFKMASNNWYSLISEDYKFAKLHLNNSPSASDNLLIFQTVVAGIFQYSDINSYESRKVKFPVEIKMPCRLIGSANGLICVASWYRGYRCFIWNPCTSDYKIISIGTVGSNVFGFGYDSISDDYKMVAYWSPHVYFFSLKTNSWKILRDEYSFKYAPVMSVVHSNGALHWCVDSQIVAFDLRKEKTFFMALPEEISHIYDTRHSVIPLFDYQGSLCAYSPKSIWVMKEYGNISSWTKLSTSMPEELAKPVGISRVGEVVFRAIGGVGLVKSAVKGRMFDIMLKILLYGDAFDGFGPVQSYGGTFDHKEKMFHYEDAFVYKESVISPKCFDSRR